MIQEMQTKPIDRLQRRERCLLIENQERYVRAKGVEIRHLQVQPNFGKEINREGRARRLIDLPRVGKEES